MDTILHLAQRLCEADGYFWELKDFTETPNGQTVEEFHEHYIQLAITARDFFDEKRALQLRESVPAAIMVNTIIGAYHTTRLADTPASLHILSKRHVQKAVANFAESWNQDK